MTLIERKLPSRAVPREQLITEIRSNRRRAAA